MFFLDGMVETNHQPEKRHEGKLSNGHTNQPVRRQVQILMVLIIITLLTASLANFATQFWAEVIAISGNLNVSGVFYSLNRSVDWMML